MKTSAPTPPPAPVPVDPGQAATSYLTALSDPTLQARLFAAESTYRPQYTDLNLQDMQGYLNGVNGRPGALDMFADASARAQQVQSAANTAQRQADINDVMNLGPAAAEAFKRANPELAQQMARASSLQDYVDPFTGLRDMANDPLGKMLYQRAQGPAIGAVGTALQGRAAELANSTGQLTSDELRQSQQAIREAYGAQGRGLDSAAISGEALSRLANSRQRTQEDLAMASGLNQGALAEQAQNSGFSQGVYGQRLGLMGNLGQLDAGQLGQDRSYALRLAQAQAAVAADPFMAILGRPSGALQYGAGQQGFAGDLTQSMQGPQLFNVDAGVNLALQNNANSTGYNNNIYGAQAGIAGANIGAQGQIIGAGLSAIGSFASGVASAKAQAARGRG